MARTPITRNPFIVGNPVRDRSMFFGREAEFELVRRRFVPPAQGGLLVFCGERRSGKTSILFQIMDGRLGPEFLPVLIDMQSMAVESEADFLRFIAAEVHKSLGPDGEKITAPDFAASARPCSVFASFVGELCRSFPGKTLLLLFDEYELLGNKIDAGVLSEDVLHMLASVMEMNSVCIVFTGSQHIEQRKQSYWRILGKSLYRVISYLQRDDTIRLIRRPVEGQVRYLDDTVDQIIRLTSGQPFYTQAICQNLVDHLNESRSDEVGPAAVNEVVNDIVENPFPQMIFLWDGLERDEKITLALLAERLENGEDSAGAEDLLATVKAGEYPFPFTRARLAGALENLFKAEFLLKFSGTPPGYAFRMDLWRLWIRRMHSVWQVLREEGMTPASRAAAPRWWRVPAVVGTTAVLLLAAISIARHPSGKPAAPSPSGLAPRPARIALQSQPAATDIVLDGNQVGQGRFHGVVSLGPHNLHLSASGYADSALVIDASAGDSVVRKIELRPLRGDLEVRTDPPGAEVTVDGVSRGRSPVTVRGLEVPRSHAVAAAMEGRGPAEARCEVASGRVKTLTLTLAEPKAELSVDTTPAGAEILLDGRSRGLAPMVLRDLSLHTVRVAARCRGYVELDTAVALRDSAQDLRLRLRPEPPGALMVMGDSPASIYLDGVLVKENVQNSGRRSVSAGNHHVQVVLVSGETVEDSLPVGPGEFAVYDYSLRRVVRRTTAGGSEP